MDLATSYVRGLQFQTLFANDKNFEATFVSRMPAWLISLERIWPRRRWLGWPIRWFSKFWINRQDAKVVRLAKNSDLVYLITVPSYQLHRRLKQLSVPVVHDLIDAVWLPWFQKLGWENIEKILSTSDAVICDNDITAKHVSQYNRRVFVSPDSPQLSVFDSQRTQVEKPADRVVIGWIGGQNTADALYKIFEPLETLFKKYSHIHLRILGVTEEALPRFENVRYSVLPNYSQSVLVKEALAMHIGLFPQFDVTESEHRGTLKAKIYMSAQAVAVCENIGANPSLIEDGQTGCLASTAGDWFEKLSWLIEDAGARDRIATAGLATIRNEYSEEKCYERLRSILSEVLGL